LAQWLYALVQRELLYVELG